MINPTKLWDAGHIEQDFYKHSSAVHDPGSKYIRPEGRCKTRKASKAYSSPLTVAGTHQVGGEQGLEMQQKTSGGDLLQPAATGFPDFHSQRWELDLAQPTTALRKNKPPPPDSDWTPYLSLSWISESDGEKRVKLA